MGSEESQTPVLLAPPETNEAAVAAPKPTVPSLPEEPSSIDLPGRLYFAQTIKCTVDDQGHWMVPERLARFAGPKQEVILIGVGDHVELWDAARWRDYAQQHGAGTSAK